MNGVDPSLPKITRIVGRPVVGWFHHGPGVLLAFTDPDEELKALKLVPVRARDGSAQLNAEVIDSHSLQRLLSVARKDAEEHQGLLDHIHSLFHRAGDRVSAGVSDQQADGGPT